MKMTDFINSNYLRAEDLDPNVRIEATIAAVRSREFEDGSVKPVVFLGDGRGVVLNQSRLKGMIAAYGLESDNWVGRAVVVSRGTTLYQGKSVPAIMVDPVVATRIGAEQRPALEEPRRGSIDIRSGKGSWDDPPPPDRYDGPDVDDPIDF
jgi:hypothetical protein